MFGASKPPNMRTPTFLSSLAILACVGFFTPNNVQAQVFTSGTNVVGLGVGLGGTYGFAYTSSSPAISANFEHGMGFRAGPGTVGIGGYLGYKSVTNSWDLVYTHYDYTTTYMMLGARGTYHYNDWHHSDKLDTYAGVLLGWNIASSTHFADSPYYTYTYPSGGFSSSLFAGARYYFSDAFGVYGEVGYGISYLTLGLAFKF